MGFTQSRWGHLEVLTAIGSRQAMSACGNLRRGCPVPGPGAQQPTANHGERGGGGRLLSPSLRRPVAGPSHPSFRVEVFGRGRDWIK